MEGGSRTLLLEGGAFRDIGTLPGGISTRGARMNDRGQIAGEVVGEGGVSRAFVYRAGGMVELPSLAGPAGATAINARGDAVGWACTGLGYDHAVLWPRRGGVVDLGDLGGGYSRATGIDARGAVVGENRTAAGEIHAFLWRRGRMIDLGALPGHVRSSAVDIGDDGTAVGWSAPTAGSPRSPARCSGGRDNDSRRRTMTIARAWVPAIAATKHLTVGERAPAEVSEKLACRISGIHLAEFPEPYLPRTSLATMVVVE